MTFWFDQMIKDVKGLLREETIAIDFVLAERQNYVPFDGRIYD